MFHCDRHCRVGQRPGKHRRIDWSTAAQGTVLYCGCHYRVGQRPGKRLRIRWSTAV